MSPSTASHRSARPIAIVTACVAALALPGAANASDAQADTARIAPDASVSAAIVVAAVPPDPYRR